MIIKIPIKVKKTIFRMFHEETRVFPLLMKYKTAVCTRRMLIHANLVFEERLENLVVG